MRLIILVTVLTSLLFPQNRWIKLNGPEGGFITALYSKGDTVIAGSEKGRIFFSTDKGINWEGFKTNINERVVDFTYSPDGAIYSAIGKTLYKSYDLQDWSPMRLNRDYERLFTDYKGTIYAGSTSDILLSSDSGASWRTNFITTRSVTSFGLLSGNILIAGIGNRIIRKKPDFASWEIVFTDTTWAPDIGIYIPYHVIPGDSGYAFAHGGTSILKSIDTGKTWQQQPSGTFFYGNSMYSAIYNNRIIGAFRDETSWFGDGWGVAVSDDKGITWRWSQIGLPKKISANNIASSGDDTYLGTNAAGVFKSTDFGESWFPVNKGITAAIVRDFVFDEDGTIYTSSWSNGVAKSTDKGANWEVINNGLSNVYMYSILNDDDGVLYAGSDQGLFRSTDKGVNWVETTGFGNSYAYRLHKDNQSRIYAIAYGYGIYRTTDKGYSWDKIDKGFANQYVFGFAIDSSGSIYAGTRGGYIYKSSDDGENWTEVRNTIHTSSVVERISIAGNGYIFATTTREGVLRSTDEGLNWEQVNNGLGSLTTAPLAIDKTDRIYTTTSELKIYQSEDYGESWIDITGNLNLTAISKIMFDEEYIYLSTDESMWRSNPDSLTSIAEDENLTPKEYSLSQNYPNPFNPNTIIKYQIPVNGLVSMKIYDILGKEISTLVHEEKSAGRYEVNFNASNLASGVYIYRVKVNEFVESKKMVLMK